MGSNIRRGYRAEALVVKLRALRLPKNPGNEIGGGNSPFIQQ
jgi:hypothetical protein